MRATVILLFITSLSFGQKAIRTDQGYLIPDVEDFSELVYLGQAGKFCMSKRANDSILIAQILRSNIERDSNSIRLQKELFALKNKSLDRETQFRNCVQQNAIHESTIKAREKSIEDLQKQLKKIRWENAGLKIGAGTLIALAIYFAVT